jgi:twinkle protein
MESTARNAPYAPLNGAKNGTHALPSSLKGIGHAGSAIIVDGQGVSRPRLSAAAIAYAASRGISQTTLERVRAVSAINFFPRRLNANSECIRFPYFLDGEVVNWKACAFPEKDFIGKKGGQLCFLGLDDALAAEPGDIWIVEGEWDRASLIEAGLPLERVLSVPNGAREKPAGATEERRAGYGYVLDALKRGLGKHQRFIWAGDTDAAGVQLRHDMAHLLGQARFWYAEWPEGCKDANDYLRSDGPQAVRELVTDGILRWPVAGLYSMRELPEPGPLEVWHVPHMPSWRGRIALAPGTMSIVIGHPGHGKTALWTQIWHDIAATHDLALAVASFETRAKPHYRRVLRQLHLGKLERDMDANEMAAADKWIDERYSWIVHPEQKPTLSWLLEMAEVAVVRNGAKVIQLDPWNRLESQREMNETETEYIGRCLTAAYTFALDMSCHVQIIVHPAKMDSRRRGQPPELEDANASAHFNNRTDQGFTVHRPKLFDGAQARTEADLYHRKARFPELGHPCRVPIRYDYRTGRFVEKEDD